MSCESNATMTASAASDIETVPHLDAVVTLTPESHDVVPLTNAHEPELRPTEASVLHQPHCSAVLRLEHAEHVEAPFLHAWLRS